MRTTTLRAHDRRDAFRRPAAWSTEASRSRRRHQVGGPGALRVPRRHQGHLARGLGGQGRRQAPRASPQIEEGAKAIVEAKLPEFSVRSREAWDEQVKTLQAVVAAYAAPPRDPTTSVTRRRGAAPRPYEAMVRLIRPPLPELEAFHVVLYQLYHVDMPAGDVKAMRATIERMKEPLATLESAKLPEKWSKEQAERSTTRGRSSSSR